MENNGKHWTWTLSGPGLAWEMRPMLNACLNATVLFLKIQNPISIVVEIMNLFLIGMHYFGLGDVLRQAGTDQARRFFSNNFW
jgi:hypothetical protein